MNEGHVGKVSVVIPTTGRSSALRAIDSVLAQTHPDVEVVLVYDGAGELPFELPDTARVRLLVTGGRRGVSAARAAGIQSARGAYVALLDDDDAWTPEKLAVQLRLIAERATSTHVVCLSRVRLVDVEGRPQMVVPSRLIRPGESVAEYLFVRRRVRWGETLIHPSTLICDRTLAIEMVWKSIEMHEDWDWVLRIAARGDVDFLMADEPLVIVTETPGSASRSANWRGSLAWADASRPHLTDREWADLLLCTTAAYAKADGSRRAAVQIALRSIRHGRPGLPALVFFTLFQIAPSHFLTRLARLVARR